jgi:hypothetical protein
LGQGAFDGLSWPAYDIIALVPFIPVITIGAAVMPIKIVWRLNKH